MDSMTAGVSREEIISDYLLTNEYIKNDVLYLTEFVKQMAGTTGEAADESLWNLFRRLSGNPRQFNCRDESV
jgi:protein tyrosine/serine phosphatase